MKPIYFPFTYITQPVVEAARACFQQLVVYQPSNQKVPDKMQQWAKNGILDIRVPVKRDEQKLNAIVNNYRTWANIHQESGISFFKTQIDAIPFFGESSVEQIRADIKKSSQDAQSQKKPDHLFNVRLFLQIAQEFDMQSWEIDRELRLCENMELDLMQNLKGQDDFSDKGLIGNRALETDDPHSYMIPERMEAWTYLMHYDQSEYDHEMSGLFITSNRSVLEYLIDQTPAAEKLCGFDSIPAYKNEAHDLKEWRAGLMQHLDMLVENEWNGSFDIISKAPAAPGCDKKFSLTLYVVPQKTPRDFFASFIKHKAGLLNAKNTGVRFKNTLIGLIEPNQ